MNVSKLFLWAIVAIIPFFGVMADTCWSWEQREKPKDLPKEKEEEITYGPRFTFVEDTLPVQMIDRMIKDGFSMAKLTMGLNGIQLDEQFVGLKGLSAQKQNTDRSSGIPEVILYKTHYALSFEMTDDPLFAATRIEQPNTYLSSLLIPEEREGSLSTRGFRAKNPILDQTPILGQSDISIFLDDRFPSGWYYVVDFNGATL